MGHLNDTLKLKIERIQLLEPKLTPESYTEKLTELKKEFFIQLVDPDYCELDLSEFEKLNRLIEDAYEILLERMGVLEA